MKEIARTNRLRIYLAVVPANEESGNVERDQFLAYHRFNDRMILVANMIVFRSFVVGDYVEWIEVSDDLRRQGFGTELFRAVEKYYGTELVAEGATEAGEAFVDALDA